MYLSKHIVQLGVKLDWTCLRGADLRFADLSGLDLDSIDFSRANLTGANLMNANLRYCQFNEANLTNTNLSGAVLYGADFLRAQLINTDFTFAVLTDAHLYPRGDYWSTRIRNCAWEHAVMTDGRTFGESDPQMHLFAPLMNRYALVDDQPRGRGITRCNGTALIEPAVSEVLT